MIIRKQQNTRRGNNYEAAQVQIDNVLKDLDEIQLNHLDKHQKKEIGICLGTRSVDRNCTALAEKNHLKH